jgi:hypothetical protein
MPYYLNISLKLETYCELLFICSDCLMLINIKALILQRYYKLQESR